MKIEKSPSMPLYGKDAYDDEKFARLSYGAQGLFWRLAWWQWQEGSIPSDLQDVIAVAGKDKETGRVWPEVERLFPVCEDGRRRNSGVEKKRTVLAEMRAKRQQAVYKRHTKPLQTVYTPLGDEEAIAIANATATEEAKAISMQYGHPPIVIQSWLDKITHDALRTILVRYGDKNVAYIDRVVETKVSDMARNVLQMGVGRIRESSAREKMQHRIDAWEMENPRPLNPAMKGDWLARFESVFGFALESFNDATDEQIESWLRTA